MNDTRSPTNILLGLIFMACGGAVMIFLAMTTTLECVHIEPRQVDCLRRVTLLSYLQLSQDAIQHVQSARVNEMCDEDCTYRVEMVTRDGVVPVTSYYSSGYEPKQEAADQINAFVSNPERDPLTVRLSGFANAGLFSLIPFAFMLIGAWLVIQRVIVWWFDRKDG